MYANIRLCWLSRQQLSPPDLRFDLAAPIWPVVWPFVRSQNGFEAIWLRGPRRCRAKALTDQPHITQNNFE